MKKSITTILMIGAMLLNFQSCKKEPDNSSCETDIPNSGTPIPFTILSDSVESPNCKSKLVEFGPEWREIMSLDPQGSVIYPGGDLLQPSVQSGEYKPTPFTSNRKPIKISVSLQGIAGNPSRTLDHPSLSSARTAMNEILQQQLQGSSQPAQIAWSQTQIYNERHFKLAVGGNYGNLFMDINAQFNYNSSSVMGRFLFQFTQVYYSVDCDAPNAGIENFYNTIPSCAQLGGYSPCYVSSVKYGRKVFLMIESDQFDYSAMAEIRASFDAFLSSGGVNGNSTLSNLITKNSIKGVIIGGPAYEGVQVVNNLSKLKDYLLAGANFDMSSPGVPLSYTLRFMKDNSVASIIKYDKFTIRECTIIPAATLSLTITPSEIDELRLYRTKGDQEFGGNGPKVTVTVSYSKRNSSKELWQTVDVTMEEAGGDYTTGKRTYERKVWTAPTGKNIISFSHSLGNQFSDTWHYTDIGPGMDVNSFPASNLMKYIRVLGDTYDDDVTANSYSSSHVEEWSHIHELQFNSVKIRYQ